VRPIQPLPHTTQHMTSHPFIVPSYSACTPRCTHRGGRRERRWLLRRRDRRLRGRLAAWSLTRTGRRRDSRRRARRIRWRRCWCGTRLGRRGGARLGRRCLRGHRTRRLRRSLRRRCRRHLRRAGGRRIRRRILYSRTHSMPTPTRSRSLYAADATQQRNHPHRSMRLRPTNRAPEAQAGHERRHQRHHPRSVACAPDPATTAHNPAHDITPFHRAELQRMHSTLHAPWWSARASLAPPSA
jgi:hypothetical protein